MLSRATHSSQWRAVTKVLLLLLRSKVVLKTG